MGKGREQRLLSADPQNLSWANDTDSIGQRLLQKMGWNGGSGLTTDSTDKASTIPTAASVKRDFAGLGMDAHEKAKEEREGKGTAAVLDFESILKNLNNDNGNDKKERKEKRKKDRSSKKEKDSSLSRVKSKRRREKVARALAGVSAEDLKGILRG